MSFNKIFGGEIPLLSSIHENFEFELIIILDVEFTLLQRKFQRLPTKGRVKHLKIEIYE